MLMVTSKKTSAQYFRQTFKFATTSGVRPLFCLRGFIAELVQKETPFQTKKFKSSLSSCKAPSSSVSQAPSPRTLPWRALMENVCFAKCALNFSNLGHSVTTVSKSTNQTQTLWTASYGSAATTATNGTMLLARLISDKIRI